MHCLQVHTAPGMGLVTGLSVHRSSVLACSHMTSLTVFMLEFHSGKPHLEAVSTCTGYPQDGAQEETVAAAGDAAAAVWLVQAAILVNDQLILAGVYPDQLFLLRRDGAEEMAALDCRRRDRLNQQPGIAASCACMAAIL